MACEKKNIHVVTIHSAFGGTLCLGCTTIFLKCNNQSPTLTDAMLFMIPFNMISRQVVLTLLCVPNQPMSCHKCWSKTGPNHMEEKVLNEPE